MILGALALVVAAVPEPKPYGPIPTPAQLQWQQMEFTGFLHFTVNTFTDREWGQGDEPESVFNPTEFDADQIALVAKRAGMKGLILTAKHHDGFCLWPTKTTAHNSAHSPFGRDVVKLVSEACHRAGLKFGVYLSPWDRNNAAYGTAAYVDLYRQQLTELLTGYGPIFEVWHDGANGGDGYYGGARERRTIDPSTYYGWPTTWALVHRLQPGAVIFSDVGPGVRWVGNENGVAGDPCWATFKPEAPDPGRVPAPGYCKTDLSPNGTRHGGRWLPAECDVSIRPGWFYHSSEDDKVKTAEQLKEIYFKSVGRGAGLLLNVPPDRKGQIHPGDVRALSGFKRLLDAAFAKDLARTARITASNVRGEDGRFGPGRLNDGDRDSCWATDDNVLSADATLWFTKPVTFNTVRVREALRYGQRVDEIALDAWLNGAWVEVARASSVGNCRLIQIEPVTTRRVRLRVTKASACPCLSELALFLDPNEQP